MVAFSGEGWHLRRRVHWLRLTSELAGRAKHQPTWWQLHLRLRGSRIAHVMRLACALKP